MTDDKILTTEIAVRNKFTDYFTLYNILPDPDPILTKQGIGNKVYHSLLNDAQVSACYQSRKAGVLSKEWSVDRGKAKSKNAQIIQDIFNNLDINTFISDILEASFFGFQPIEIIWEYTPSGIYPKELKAKPQDWFAFNTNNELVLKKSFGEIELLPQHKFLCPVSGGSYINPFGTKVLSKCFWPVAFKKNVKKFWLNFTEKFGMPHIVGKLPAGKSREEIEEFAEALNSMVQDAIIVITDDCQIEYKEPSAKAASAEIYEKLDTVCNADIAKAIIGQTLTTEVGKTGSYAASKTHFEVRQDIVESDKKLVEKTVNQLINWIYQINWQGSADKPVFSMWEEEDVDKDLAERDKILADTGVKFTKKYFIKTYGFDEEDIELEPKIQPENKINFSDFAEKKQEDYSDQNIIDNLINSFSDSEIQNNFKDVLNPVLNLFNQDPNLALEKLADIYPEMNSEKLEKTLANIIFISEIWGNLNA